MDTMLIGVEGAAAYLDDITVVGQSKWGLTECINKILTHIQDFGFQLRPEKCNFYLYAIKYLEFIFSHQGHCPDPVNVAAIQCMYSMYATPIRHKQFTLISQIDEPLWKFSTFITPN